MNPEVIDQLRQLKAPQFILVTKPQNMRGLDYRSTDTITLFLARRCDSQRSLTQAFGRVGRYSEDTCHRLVDMDLQDVTCVKPTDAISYAQMKERAAALAKHLVRANLDKKYWQNAARAQKSQNDIAARQTDNRQMRALPFEPVKKNATKDK